MTLPSLRGLGFCFLAALTVSYVFPERARELAGGARATVPPGGATSAQRARAAGGPAAGVSAKCGQAEGGAEECGDGEGEGGGPAEGPTELETYPPEQPACYNTAG